MGNKPIKLPQSAYWRYKKEVPPIDEFLELNGPVKVIKPANFPHPNK